MPESETNGTMNAIALADGMYDYYDHSVPARWPVRRSIDAGRTSDWTDGAAVDLKR